MRQAQYYKKTHWHAPIANANSTGTTFFNLVLATFNPRFTGVWMDAVISLLNVDPSRLKRIESHTPNATLAIHLGRHLLEPISTFLLHLQSSQHLRPMRKRQLLGTTSWLLTRVGSYVYIYIYIRTYNVSIYIYIQIDCLGPSSIIKSFVPLSCIDIVWRDSWSLGGDNATAGSHFFRLLASFGN